MSSYSFLSSALRNVCMFKIWERPRRLRNASACCARQNGVSRIVLIPTSTCENFGSSVSVTIAITTWQADTPAGTHTYVHKKTHMKQRSVTVICILNNRLEIIWRYQPRHRHWLWVCLCADSDVMSERCVCDMYSMLYVCLREHDECASAPTAKCDRVVN